MTQLRPSIADKRRAFQRCTSPAAFCCQSLGPGSARYLQSLGFKALATTSAGFAWSRPARQWRLRETMLQHLAAMVEATDLPHQCGF